MKKTETIDLIKGTFTPSEARELISQLITSKINFHNLRNWSSREQSGMSDGDSEQRLKYLEEARKNLETFVSKAIDEQKNITINSNIEMDIE